MRFSDADPLYQDRVEGVPVVAVMIPKSKPTHIDGRRPDVDHDVQPFAPTPQSRVPNHERGDLREHLYTAEVWVRCDRTGSTTSTRWRARSRRRRPGRGGGPCAAPRRVGVALRRHAVAPALIFGQPLVSKAKSVMLTDAGLRRAKAACRRLFEADE